MSVTLTAIDAETGIKKTQYSLNNGLVLAKDTDTGVQSYKPVEQTFQFTADEILTLDILGEQVETTANHSFWIKGKGWVTADELVVGDEIEAEDGSVKPISRIRVSYDSTVNVYNFTVEDYSTYYISSLGLLTHNLSEDVKLITTERLLKIDLFLMQLAMPLRYSSKR